MKICKRIFLFIFVNVLIITSVSIIFSFFNIKPYLSRYGMNYSSLFIFCLIWGMVGAFISLLLSKKMAKWMLKIKIITDFNKNEKESLIFNMVKELSQKENIKMPEIGIYSSKEVNAFATGASKNRSLIALSSSLLETLDEQEIKAVLSHEISHITSGDMVTMTLLQGIINAFVMFLARVIAYALSSRSRDRNNSFNYFSYMMMVFLFQFVFMIPGSLIIAFFSRRREFRADKNGAFLCGKENMIKALSALKKVQDIKDPKLSDAIKNFKISNFSKKGGILKLFLSHPPLEKRIERLKSL